MDTNWLTTRDDVHCARCGGTIGVAHNDDTQERVATCRSCHRQAIQAHLQCLYCINPRHQRSIKCHRHLHISARQTQREKYARRIAKGLCPWCGKINSEETRLHARCYQTARKSGKKCRAKKKKLGICGQCSQPAMEGKRCCAYHHEINLALTRQRFAKRHRKQCLRCGAPTEAGNTYCEGHRLLLNQRAKFVYQQKKAQGICVACKRPAGKNSILCDYHHPIFNERSRRAKKAA